MRRGTSGYNLLLGIDKPTGMTSHDVVNHVRRAMGEKRVGHAGTLDPAASGVMVVGVGQATRLMGLMTAERKSYRATIAFGWETDTEDAEGKVTRTAPITPKVGEKGLAQGLIDGFMGPSEQVPPAYSAISVNGRRAYSIARGGGEVELPARPIEVHKARLLEIDSADDMVFWTVDFTVSKGTYIRSLARDLGRAAGSAAHLATLRRTGSGQVALASCLPLEEVDSAPSADWVAGHALDPARAAGLAVRDLTESELADALCGRRLRPGTVTCTDGTVRPPAPGESVALVSDGRLYGVWAFDGRSLSCTANFPEGIQGVRR